MTGEVGTLTSIKVKGSNSSKNKNMFMKLSFLVVDLSLGVGMNRLNVPIQLGKELIFVYTLLCNWYIAKNFAFK